MAVIADLQAIRKVGGFLAPSAGLFCSYCDCLYENLDSVNPNSWTIHNSVQVLQQAQEWLSLNTKDKRKKFATATGVRWTPLNHLPYWDPVRNLILGFMHNWLEGILEHQLRTLWGIGRDTEKAKALDEAYKELIANESYTERDLSESESELEELREEAEEYASSQSQSATLSSEQSTPTPQPTPSISPGALPMEIDNADDEDEDLDPDYIPLFDDQKSVFKFSENELSYIHDCIHEVWLPTWVDRPPINLGMSKHGKLKANDYLVLFSVIFPLVMPKLWWNGNERECRLLESYVNLTAATNIICSFETSNFEAEQFTQFYIAYRISIQQLFPECHDLPNHHFAMHNEMLLKHWGPLAGLSEFPGERLNGMLQKVKTNHRVYDMAYTMLKQMCRQLRLKALWHDNDTGEDSVRELHSVINPNNKQENQSTGILSTLEFVFKSDWKTPSDVYRCPSP
ncbi:hypothetical protein GYMLUDRAFT_251161 [Collybiopsis luxurians FD-317 M1]|uniref:Unplaced genomic scaffold GYMLUscaffold_93, whole genome shotgun sequence n=1 Tax=Collybiopsis luxurians FD-317 M1 TaxID=944289 RepID=A0A0D0CCF7_9AGAR|nr:hypothetical protein GYMLUDRAFT_251161 [Collybiopsis luxurians FD-317 M1]